MDVTAIDLLRWLHVVGATLLLGTGSGIAFFMWMAHRTGDARLIAHVAGTVVIADTVFTATAVVLQPITGALLAHVTGWPLSTGWIVLSLALYLVTGAFWLPVVWIQIRLRTLARAAVQTATPLSRQYTRLFRIWLACGVPAFAAVLTILWLMLKRPGIVL